VTLLTRVGPDKFQKSSKTIVCCVCVVMYHIHYITMQAPRTTTNSSFERVCNCLWKEWKIVVLRCHDDIVAQNYRSSAAKSVQSMYMFDWRQREVCCNTGWSDMFHVHVQIRWHIVPERCHRRSTWLFVSKPQEAIIRWLILPFRCCVVFFMALHSFWIFLMVCIANASTTHT